MRASDLEGKEVIALESGERLGVIQKTELLVDINTGMVEALIFISYGIGGREKGSRTIPWQNIKKIGADLVIVSNYEVGFKRDHGKLT